jgi:hypothetical protein
LGNVIGVVNGLFTTAIRAELSGKPAIPPRVDPCFNINFRINSLQMAKKKRVVYTRGGAAETPNWRFGLRASIPRDNVPEFCEGLDFLARERAGGSYFYPDYKNGKMAAAFEWYLPYRGWPFGYKAGVEFWIDEGDLQQIGAYVLYGPDHPQIGQTPALTQAEEAKFQHEVTKMLKLATDWRRTVKAQQFFTVHYLQLPDSRVIRSTIEISSLSSYLLPTVLMGKENKPVSAIIQAISAKFIEQARALGARGFATLCALLTLSTGSHYEGYKSTLGRTPLKKFVDTVSPLPSLDVIYPRGKFSGPPADWQELPRQGFTLAARCYGSLDSATRLRFDRSLFAYYTVFCLSVPPAHSGFGCQGL